MKADVAAGGSDIVPFYRRIGVAVLGTVIDADCGIDTMRAMLRRPQTVDARKEIREELHDYRNYEPHQRTVDARHNAGMSGSFE
jgi:galactokinase/mevalonate kinase-like predicted kinase